MSKTMQVLPLPKVHPEWDSKHLGRYPDRIRVSMSDGKVITYRIEVNQPAPVLRESLDSFSELCVGYEKPADAGTSDRQKKGLRGKYTTEKEN